MKNILSSYFNDINTLVNNAGYGKDKYIEPALKNLGSVCIPIVREIIAPAVFRNGDPEITDIGIANERRVRAIANKFKYGERSRGLQILRAVNAGGVQAQNKTIIEDKSQASTAFDLNTVVFGDSANRAKQVLPVKASAQYSDAISIAPYVDVVDETFSNRGAEDGTLWDSAKNANSNHIFTRYFVKPGTLMLQVVTFNGKTAPIEALNHLLLSIGAAGAYGGQTSNYGVNAKSHIVGIYAGKFERAIASPYEALAGLSDEVQSDVSSLLSELDAMYGAAYPVRVGKSEVDAEMNRYIDAIENDEAWVEKEYQNTHKKIGEYFDSWFYLKESSPKTPGKAKAKKGGE